MPQKPFIPALRFQSLTRLYDPVLRATLKEDRFKRALVEQAGLRPGMRVLDLGCGTGTLTLLIKQAYPGVELVGLDADPETLQIARAKAEQAGLDIRFEQGMAQSPPFPPGSFDRVTSSLMLHHIADKRAVLAALRALLRPGGELHVADWGKAQNALMRVAFLGVQLLDGFATTGANVRGELPQLMRDVGFASVAETRSEMTLFGTLSLYRAVAA